MKSIEIHALSQDHQPAVIQVLSEAFLDDPAMCWIFRDVQARENKLPLFFKWLVKKHQTGGLLLGGSDAQVVTLWWLPGKIHLSSFFSIADMLTLASIFGANSWRADLVNRCILKHLPPGENWLYLRYAGVEKNMRGCGFGGAGIRAGIAIANSRGLPTCLETCRPGNVAIYERLGFKVISEWSVPFGGPHFWTMVRAAD